MVLLEMIEGRGAYTTRHRAYAAFILFILSLSMLTASLGFAGINQPSRLRELTDFDDFYLAAQTAVLGSLGRMYHFADLTDLLAQVSDRAVFMPWTYPPQFALMLAPLSYLPKGVAYILFISVSLVAYLAVLRRLSGPHFVTVLIPMIPAMLITIRCGQNGFVTGALIGLVCLWSPRRPLLAGLALGAMIIKPHFGIAHALHVLINRRWVMAAAAAAMIAATSGIVTLVFGPAIWRDLLDATREARVFLEYGYYPLFRMITAYASLRSFGLPASIAIAAQGAVALFAIAIIVMANWTLDARRALGMTVCVSLIISPYGYDYDLPMLGIGLAMLMPDILRLGSVAERLALYAMVAVAGGSGITTSFLISLSPRSDLLHMDVFDPAFSNQWIWSLAGFVVLAIVLLTWRIVSRVAEDQVSTASPTAGLDVEPAAATRL